MFCMTAQSHMSSTSGSVETPNKKDSSLGICGCKAGGPQTTVFGPRIDPNRRDRATTRNRRPKLIPKLNRPKLASRPFSVGSIASLSTQNDEHAANDLRQRVGGGETAETRTAAERQSG